MQEPPNGSDFICLNGVNFTNQEMNRVIDDFYTRIQNDPILQVPFRSVADWPEHIERLTHFWWIRFGGKPYMFSQYNPIVKHFFAGFNDELLERWLSIFHDTLKADLTAEQAAIWTEISSRMGQVLSAKNESYKTYHQIR